MQRWGGDDGGLTLRVLWGCLEVVRSLISQEVD